MNSQVFNMALKAKNKASLFALQLMKKELTHIEGAVETAAKSIAKSQSDRADNGAASAEHTNSVLVNLW